MKHSSIPSAQILVQTCKSLGISRVVISPGSRNAPLIIGFTEDPYFTCYSVVDERSAGFFGLGIARESGSPVILVCTSGSALLNYYPAVAEAYYSQIPLAVVSADRPAYKVDIGDGQTIRQKDIYKKLCDINEELEQDLIHAAEEYHRCKGLSMPAEELLVKKQREINEKNERCTLKALRSAQLNRTPAHINIPFEEPLYNKVEALSYVPLSSTKEEAIEVDRGITKALMDAWRNAERKMILIGESNVSALDLNICELLGEDPSILVFTETTSNTHHSSFFSSIDSIIAPLEKLADKDQLFNALRPDLLMTIGGQIVSKKIKAFLRNYPPGSHWHLGDTRPNDTFFTGVQHLKQNPSESLGEVLRSYGSTSTDYRFSWDRIKEKYRQGRQEYLAQIPFSDFSTFATILESIPDDISVHFANSSAIRYAQLFDMQASNIVSCNRGASGIEGSTSTAIGASVISKAASLLISGDLGFLYDSNALWNDYVRTDFRMIVINNGGGGIFRILPGNDNSAGFEKFFETTHQRTCKFLCEDHGIIYHGVSNMEDLRNGLTAFYQKSDKPKLLEIFTPREENDKILLAYFDFLSSVLTN